MGAAMASQGVAASSLASNSAERGPPASTQSTNPIALFFRIAIGSLLAAGTPPEIYTAIWGGGLRYCSEIPIVDIQDAMNSYADRNGHPPSTIEELYEQRDLLPEVDYRLTAETVEPKRWTPENGERLGDALVFCKNLNIDGHENGPLALVLPPREYSDYYMLIWKSGDPVLVSRVWDDNPQWVRE
jgi:hypothetical protein